MKKIAIFATSHQPTDAQLAYFEQRGIEVVAFVDHLEENRRNFASGRDAWTKVQEVAAGREIAVVVGVMPIGMIPEYLRCCTSTPLVRADMVCTVRGTDTTPSKYEWSGTFTRTVRVDVVTEAFSL